MFGNNNGFSNNTPFGQYTPQGYQPQQAQQQAPAKLESLDDLLSGSGAKSFFNADSQPGQSVTGTLDLIETSQMRDFQTKQPAYWNDGRPQMQIHIVLQTTLRDPSVDDDDGRRSLWIKGWGIQLKAFRDACRQAGVKAPKAGDTITATFTGLGERGNAPQPPKVYAYQITPSNSITQLVNLQPTTPQQPVEQFPQQSAQSSQQQPQPRQQYAPPQQPMGQYQPQQPITPQQPAQQQPQQPAYQQPAQQYPQQPAYQQPAQQQTAQYPQPQASIQQIQQLRSLGKTDQEIAGLLGVTIQQISQIAGSPVTGSEDTPDF